MSTDGGPESLQDEIVAIERGQQLKTQEAIAEAERRAELLSKITLTAIRRTYPQDWIDFKSSASDDEGAPYLGAAGAERLRSLFGISVTGSGGGGLDIKRYEERDKEGTFYFYIVSGVAHWRGDELAVIGTCSSRDLFFRTRYQEGKKILLPSDEVDPSNIVKAARSNMLANAVTGILGLRGLTWTQLKEFGVERGKGGTATFGDRKPREGKPLSAGAADAEKKLTRVEQLEARLAEFSPAGTPEGRAAVTRSLLVAATSYPAGTSKPQGDKPGRAYKAFDGFRSIDELRNKAHDAQRTAAIALKKIDEMVAGGLIAVPPNAGVPTPTEPTTEDVLAEMPGGEPDGR